VVSIVFTEGPLAGQRFALDRDETTLGRRDCDVSIEDRQVSRRHLSLRPAGQQLDVEDLGSSNGTLVNGQRITGTVRAADGDVVRVGTSELIVQVEVPRDPTLPPMPSPVAAGAGAEGGLPTAFWAVTTLVEVALILTAATLLVYYAVS
jgi:pSer/pThr/pTyr-binding forkhead associated (FHA) protein